MHKAIDELLQAQQDTKNTRQSQIDALKQEMATLIEKKIDQLRAVVDLEISLMFTRIPELEKRIESVGSKLKHEKYDTEVTLIGHKVPYVPDEDILEKAKEIIRVGIGLPSLLIREHRDLVKIELAKKEEKIRVLRNKRKLKESEDDTMKQVFIQSSRTHVERLLELNVKAVLNELPNGNTYRVTANGRLVKKDRQ